VPQPRHTPHLDISQSSDLTCQGILVCIVLFVLVGAWDILAKPSIQIGNMEFDVETFMSDVTTALAQGSPQRLGARTQREEIEAIPHEDTLGEELFSSYEEFVQYPSDECTTPPAIRPSRRHSLQNVEFLSSMGQDNNDEDPDEFQAGNPTFFDLGISNVTLLDRHNTNI
jgi:hypothetical protein